MQGGAGTWSDGKLATQIGRNSDAVRSVLDTLVEFGAPSRILVDSKPHLGTDRMVKGGDKRAVISFLGLYDPCILENVFCSPSASHFLFCSVPHLYCRLLLY